MTEADVTVFLPKGFSNNYQYFLPDIGHEMNNGLRGGVMVNAKHKVSYLF
jgi:hypothetical protein